MVAVLRSWKHHWVSQRLLRILSRSVNNLDGRCLSSSGANPSGPAALLGFRWRRAHCSLSSVYGQSSNCGAKPCNLQASL